MPLTHLTAAGKISDRSQVSYSLSGSPALQAFSVMSALGIIAFSFGDVRLCPRLYAASRLYPESMTTF